MSTEEMVRRCVKKDQAAWSVFIQRYQDIVRRAVYYKLYKSGPNTMRNDVDDIVQEIFLALWEDNKLSKLRDISCLKSWLVVVTINMTAGHRRSRYKRDKMTTSLNEQVSDDVGTTLQDIIPCKQPDPAQSAERKEAVLHVEERMSSLRMKERRALRLKIYDGKKQRDIAKIMNLPIGSVASLISRAKTELRTGLVGILRT